MLILITPTGARPSQFDLCQKFMLRQTYTGSVTWIIVDDALPMTTNQVTQSFRKGWTIIKLQPKPAWMKGQNTQGRNIIAALNYIQGMKIEEVKCIFIIEDDDYYRPIYLERMMANLNGYDLIGEKMTIYYNVTYRKYIVNGNTSHASLFQTAFTPRLIDLMRQCHQHRFIDAELWKRATNKHLFKENDLAIGMKGMPGRAGIGAGHGKLMNMHPDTEMKYLHNHIGDDIQYYSGYYSFDRFPQYQRPVKKRRGFL